MNDDILRKIKRCMDLSKSDNENEAALAFKQMQSLMSKHNVTSQDVLASDVTKSSSVLNMSDRVPKWIINLHSTIGQALDCEGIVATGGKKIILSYLGVGVTPEIAGYAFDVMYRKLRHSRAVYIKEKLYRFKRANKTKMADAFCEGWVFNIYKKVKNLNPNQEVSEKINAYKKTKLENFDDDFFEAKSRVNYADEKSQAAIADGLNASNDVDLFVAAGNKSQKLIEG